MSSKRLRKRENRRLRIQRAFTPEKVKSALKNLAAAGFIETVDGAPLPEGLNRPFDMRVIPGSVLVERLKADPGVYKTPAGNMLAMKRPNGDFDHWMTPDEAREWQVNAPALDAENPEGMKSRT